MSFFSYSSGGCNWRIHERIEFIRKINYQLPTDFSLSEPILIWGPVCFAGFLLHNPKTSNFFSSFPLSCKPDVKRKSRPNQRFGETQTVLHCRHTVLSGWLCKIVLLGRKQHAAQGRVPTACLSQPRTQQPARRLPHSDSRFLFNFLRRSKRLQWCLLVQNAQLVSLASYHHLMNQRKSGPQGPLETSGPMSSLQMGIRGPD